MRQIFGRAARSPFGGAVDGRARRRGPKSARVSCGGKCRVSSILEEQQHESAVAELESASAHARFDGRFLKMIANSDRSSLKKLQARERDEYQIDRDFP